MLQDVWLKVLTATPEETVSELEKSIRPHRIVYTQDSVFVRAELDLKKSIDLNPNGWCSVSGPHYKPRSSAPEVTAVYTAPAALKKLMIPYQVFVQSSEFTEEHDDITTINIVSGYNGEILTNDRKVSASLDKHQHKHKLIFLRKALAVLELEKTSSSSLRLNIRRYQAGVKNRVIFQKSLNVPVPSCLKDGSYKKCRIKDEDIVWVPAFEAAIDRMRGQCGDTKPCPGHYFSVA